MNPLVSVRYAMLAFVCVVARLLAATESAEAPSEPSRAAGKEMVRSFLENAAPPTLFDLIAQRDQAGLAARIAAGADIDDYNRSGTTPLMAAIDAGNDAAVKLLLAKGANANKPDRLGASALFHAIRHDRAEFVQQLLDAGADIQRGRSERETALSGALELWRPNAVRLILLAGGDPLTTFRGQGIIHVAAVRGEADIVEMLVAKGESIDRPIAATGATPLIRAAQAGAPNAVRVVLQFHPNVNLRDKRGRTALMYVSERGMATVCQALLSAGAKVNGADDEKETAYTLAGQRGYSAVVELLRKAGADPQPLRLPSSWAQEDRATVFSRAKDFPPTMGALELFYRGGSPESFPDRSRSAIVAQAELASQGIRTAEDLLHRLDALVAEDSAVADDAAVANLSEVAFARRIDAALDDPVKVLGLKEARKRGKLDRNGFLAWRLCHHNYLATVGIAAGYLATPEALRRMTPAAETFQAHYRSWAEAAPAIAEGMKTGDADPARIDALVALFLSQADKASPWTQHPIPKREQ